MALQETDLQDRYLQANGEAHAACQRLGRNADPTYLAPRGADYGDLKRALDNLEGSCRQYAHSRADARWLKLGVQHAKVRQMIQTRFVGQRWQWFADLKAYFENDRVRFLELAEAKTGARGPILPKRPSDWIIMPEQRSPYQPVSKVLN